MTWYDTDFEISPTVAQHITGVDWCTSISDLYDVAYLDGGPLMLKLIKHPKHNVVCVGFEIDNDIRPSTRVPDTAAVLEVEFDSHFIAVEVPLFAVDSVLPDIYYAVFSVFKHLKSAHFIGIASFQDPISVYEKRNTRVIDCHYIAEHQGGML